MARWLILFALCALPSASANSEGSYHIYTEAQFALTTQAEIPNTFTEVVQLPDFWHTTKRFENSPTGWYKIDLPPKSSIEPHAFFLPKHTQIIDAYFNGELLGSSGQVDPASGDMPINFNRPYLFTIPNALWQPENNRLELRLTTMRNWGLLGPVVVGSSESLSADYKARFFAQITVNQVASWVCLLLAVIAMVYWYSDRQETQYLWFGVGCFAWGVVAANNYLTWFPISVEIWSILFHSALEIFAVSITLFIHRHLSIQRKRLEIVLIALVGFAIATYAAEYLIIEKKATALFHVATLVLGLYNIYVTTSTALRAPTLRHISLAIPILIITLLGIHDALFSRGVIGDAWYTQFYSGLFATPLMMGFLLVILSKDFVAALQVARNANLQLEDRVADISAQLERSFEERREAARQQAELQERERIYRDLHDDVGAKLLSLVYSAEDDKQVQIARSAIDDIRSLMKSQDGTDTAPDNYAETWFDECSERCQQASIGLDWQVQTDLALSAVEGYHLTRVIRELLTNSLKHSNCLSVGISAASSESGVVVVFEDDGRGLPSHPSESQGTGMQGIQSRLQKVSGTAAWKEREDGGTRVTVSIKR